jgi:sterol desaturase/sphingolipid hydroxylase (fatty acid hydroxylase superfamily)
MTHLEIAILLLIAVLGHAMAGLWYVAGARKCKLCNRLIYDLPIRARQVRRELINSLHNPAHAIFLLAFLWAGCFQDRTLTSFVATAVLTLVWAEIWHYFSHRAFHLPSLHWIHAEHHKSRLNSPFTAISFSFTEKLIFDLGLLGVLCAVDLFFPLNFFGIAFWYVGYLTINSFSHANYEFRPATFNRHLGKVLASTTYHSLHHSRYTGNYGLGTRFLDRWLGTEWPDYEALYDRVSTDRKPLTSLAERVERPN